MVILTTFLHGDVVENIAEAVARQPLAAGDTVPGQDAGGQKKQIHRHKKRDHSTPALFCCSSF